METSIVGKYPRILCIHLKRFRYNPIENKMEKVKNYFSYPEDLKLRGIFAMRGEELTYKLLG
jgi:hypothetical protein